LFGAILVLPGAVLEGRRWHLVGAALLVAVLMYTYMFSWLSLAIALASWAVWLLVTNDRPAALRIVGIGAAASLLAFPELLLLANNSLTLSEDAQTRVGAFGGIGLHTEWLSPVFQRLLLGLPFGLLALRGAKERRENIFHTALYIAPLLPAMISDFLPQTDHFLFQAWPIFAIPMLVSGGIEGYRLLPDSGRTVVAGGFAVLAVLGAIHFATMQVRAVREVDATYAMPSDQYAAFEWIKANLSEEDTVVTPSWITNQQVAVLTEASTYLADGFLTRISNEEIADRYLRVSAAYGIDEDVVFYRIDPARDVPTSKKDVPDDELERYFDEAMVYYLFNEGIRRPDELTERTPDWRDAYERLSAAEAPLAEYAADYLFCGHRERFWGEIDPAPGTWVSEAFRDGGVVIYRLGTVDTPGAVEFAGC
jgi:hypothetical protein